MGGVARPGRMDEWQLKVSGQIESPLTINFRKLMDFNQIDLTCDVHCVTGWTLLDSKWSGVRISEIMTRVKVKNSARFVIFGGHAGYTSNVPIGEAAKENAILAHQFFGKPLKRPHGAPVRVLIPDRYFYKSVKWLEEIRFSEVDEPGFYESSGYSNSADPWKEERFE
jgi:DMSO/TMAO reductase YedYZ molybdopterin-dependent catalytic subunit